MSKAVDPDALLDSFVTHKGPPCRPSQLTGVAKQVWDRAMERTTDLPASAVAKAMRSLGANIHEQTVKHHRQGGCLTCQKK